MIKKAKVLSILFVVLGLCTVAAGRTIYVDDDGPANFNNIQAAIDDSNDGDTIIVKKGLYTEHINFYGKNITVKSTKPDDFSIISSTIIDYGVDFSGSEDPNCNLTGFKINSWIYGGTCHTHATISHCLLSGNRVPYGTVIIACDGTISNCVVTGNRLRGDVGGFVIAECYGLIKNCTIAGNNMGIWIGEQSTTTIENCIIYYHHCCPVYIAPGGTANILYSDVEGGLDGIPIGNVNWGPGNIDAVPCFVNQGYWDDPCNTPDNPWDDVWFDGDYHLKSQSGRWDVNSQGWVVDDVTSPCIDAGDPLSPIGLEPFPNGGLINMGVYGGTNKASKSYFDKPPCEIIIAGDVNGDCLVNFLDFQLMALRWGEDNNP